MSSDSDSPFATELSYSHHPKRIPLEGSDNFRDLGGYTTVENKTVRSGMIYRSGHLGRLTESDLKQLKDMKIRKIVDFRGSLEKEQDVNRIPEGADYIERPVDVAGADVQKRFKAMLKGRGGTKLDTYLIDVNQQFPREYVEVFAGWIKDLARSEDALPQVFHCTAGKDRTGFASAMLLRVLGVDEETVMQDYMLSEELLADAITRIVKQVTHRYPVPGIGKKLRPILGVHPSYLAAAFEVIHEDWGDFDGFVQGALELNAEDIEALKTIFLE